MSSWLEKGSRRRRLLIAFGIYVVVVAVMAIVAGSERLTTHTAFDHYALLADAWLHGRQDLANGPPGYAAGNDFALFEGHWYISFPPFPAMLMLPFVKLAGSAQNFQDGQFIVWLSGIGPAVLFLVLEKLRRAERSARTEAQNAALALLFAFGTVYFFTAVQGTVWYAAHVVGVGLMCIYLLYALDAENAWAAGSMAGLMFLTRPHTLLVGALFVLELARVTAKDGLATEGSLLDRIEKTWMRVDKAAFFRRAGAFAVPVAIALGVASWMNYTRFHNASPAAFGHEHLTVQWHGRMQKWGLFGYHYLAKNLGVVLTSLPYRPPHGQLGQGMPAVQINEHGLALWFTTPLYIWLLWPKRKGFLHAALWLAALGPILFDLLYQNSGWRQFGYRFSNDYAPILFVLLAIGGRPFGWMFRTAAAWALAWNLFGAVTFNRANFDRFYWRESTQRVLYQDD